MSRKVASDWNVACQDDDSSYVLLNRSRTSIVCHRRISLDIGWLMSRMEEIGLPLAYTEELEEIKFTVLRERRLQGDYLDGRIRVHCGIDHRRSLDRILVHEIAHHVDSIEDISGRDRIEKEWTSRAKFLPDGWAKQNPLEYVAIGFESYYLGTREERATMQRRNPRLLAAIKYVDSKYRKR